MIETLKVLAYSSLACLNTEQKSLFCVAGLEGAMLSVKVEGWTIGHFLG